MLSLKDNENIMSLMSPIYMLHFLVPFGSLFLAFALSYQMRKITKENEKQQELAIYQNRLTSMGEKLANISYQWRQPLTRISYIFMNIDARYDKNILDKDYFKKKYKKLILS